MTGDIPGQDLDHSSEECLSHHWGRRPSYRLAAADPVLTAWSWSAACSGDAGRYSPCLSDGEVIFVVEDSPEGGYEARALGHSIFTQADSVEELRTMVRDAVSCHFDESDRHPPPSRRGRTDNDVRLPRDSRAMRSPHVSDGTGTNPRGRPRVATADRGGAPLAVLSNTDPATNPGARESRQTLRCHL